MPKRIGRCTNFGGCNTADSKKAIEIMETQDFACPECKSNLLSADVPTGKSKKGLFIVLFILLLLGIGAFFVLQSGSKTGNLKPEVESKGQVSPPAAVPQPPTSTEVAPQPQQETQPKVEEQPSKQEKKIAKKAVKSKNGKKGSGSAPDDVDDETLQKNIKMLEKKLNNK